MVIDVGHASRRRAALELAQLVLKTTGPRRRPTRSECRARRRTGQSTAGRGTTTLTPSGTTAGFQSRRDPWRDATALEQRLGQQPESRHRATPGSGWSLEITGATSKSVFKCEIAFRAPVGSCRPITSQLRQRSSLEIKERRRHNTFPRRAARCRGDTQLEASARLLHVRVCHSVGGSV